jgi:glycosyltransferase involved in cell wall biosynthesis
VRIAIVGANQRSIGGAETYLRWVLAALVGSGHEVAWAFEWASTEPDRAVDRGIEPLRRWDLQTLPRAAFLDELAGFRPDVVFLQGSSDETLDLELSRRFPTLLFAHAFYGTCATGWRVHRIPERQVCTRRFGPACLPLNYLRGCGVRNPKGLLSSYASQRGRAEVLRGLLGMVVASEYMRQIFTDHDVPVANVHVIPYPTEVAPDLAAPLERASRSRVLFLGRLTSGKGLKSAVEAVAHAQRGLGRPLLLSVAGEGPERSRCERLAAELGVSVEFLGWVGAERRLQLLRATDLLIVPSLWPEPFGMVGIEAGCVGVPAVAYGVGGIVDWLRPGENGELADASSFDSRGLAWALERALGDAGHYRKLQLGAWRVAGQFSAERHLARLEQLFQQVSRQAA